MQKSFSILTPVNDIFEQKLDALNAKYSGKLPFSIINVTTGWVYHTKIYPVYTYLIDFPNVEAMEDFSMWISLNNF